MTTSSKVLSIALFTLLTFSGHLALAGTNWPAVSGSVRATATVVNPLGITTESVVKDSSNDELWLVRYPSPDGIQMIVQLNGDVIQTIKLDETPSLEDHDTFSLIRPREQLLRSVQSSSNAQGTVVITLISTTQ